MLIYDKSRAAQKRDPTATRRLLLLVVLMKLEAAVCSVALTLFQRPLVSYDFPLSSSSTTTTGLQ
jgi:hypothetical protein